MKAENLPPLIYLPGMEGTGMLFYRQKPSLMQHFTVYVCPHRNRAPFTYQDLVEDVKKFMDQENIPAATFAGESFGGTVALHLALQHPERVRHLVLINTFPYFRKRFRLILAFCLLPFAFVKPLDPLRRFIVGRLLKSEGVDKEGIEKLLACSFSHGYGTSLQRLKLIRQMDVRRRLRELKMPVTLIAAGRDRIVPSVKEAEWMATQIPHAQVHVLPQQGHACLISSDFKLSTLLCPA